MNATWLYQSVESAVELKRLSASRIRASLFRSRGAKLCPKVSIGASCRIDRPWGVTIGRAATLEDNVWLKLVNDMARLEVGDFAFIGRGAELDIQERIDIGAHALIAPGCFLTDHGHGLDRSCRIDEQSCLSRPIKIGVDAWLGTHVVVLAGVTIGEGAVIGAGSVVTGDIPSMAVAVGAPARVVRYRLDRERDGRY